MPSKLDVFLIIGINQKLTIKEIIEKIFSSTYLSIYNYINQLKDEKLIKKDKNYFYLSKNTKSDELFSLVYFCFKNNIDYNNVVLEKVSKYILTGYENDYLDTAIYNSKTINKYNKYLSNAGIIYIESKKPLNAFEAINNELDKWLLKMEETAKKEHFSDKQIEDLRRAAEETRKLRIEEEKRQQMMANVTGYYDVQLKYLEALNNAYTDVGKRREEMARSTLEYEKERTEIQLRMNEIVERYYDSEKNQWKENSEQAQIALRLLGLELDALGIKFVTHMETIQRPFWESLKGMVQGWSDSLADVFTDAIFEVESFGEAINKLMQQIARDVIKAGIKTQITDRITDTLFGEGGLLGKKKKQPAKEGEAEAQAIQNTLADTIKAGWEKVTGFLKGGFDGIFGFLKSGFDWVMKGLSSLFGGGGSGGGLGGMLSGVFSAVKGWYGFADGGYITEPVIGMGLHSGAGYTFGERGTEKVVSNEELRSGGQGGTISVSIPLTINGGGMSNVDVNSMKRELERVVADIVKSYL